MPEDAIPMEIIPVVSVSLLCVFFFSSIVSVEGNLYTNSHQMIISPVLKMK